MDDRLHNLRNGLSDAIRKASRAIGTPKFVLRDDLGEMTDADMIRFYRNTGKMLIWTGGSERTIYPDARVNWQFRAWHDFCHIRSQVCNRAHGPLGCFEPCAEYDVANWQCIGLSDSLARIVQCEVSGQAKHFSDTGNFADDQIEFTLANLRI